MSLRCELNHISVWFFYGDEDKIFIISHKYVEELITKARELFETNEQWKLPHYAYEHFRN